MDKLIGQARLAHAGLAHQRHYLAVPACRLRQRPMQSLELGLPSHKARQPPCRGGLEAPPQCTGPHQLKDIHRVWQALHRHGPQGVHPHQPFHQSEGAGGQPDAPRCGHLFHTRRQDRGLPHRRVVHMQVITDCPHHHFARVETHPHAQLQAPRAAHLLGGGLHGRLHGQGRVAGAQGMIFVGNRGAKQGHNAITEHLVHRALEAVHGVHHEMDGRIEELLGSFGIEPPDEFGGVLEVSKQHGHLLALTLQGRASREDLVGEMGWRVGERRPVLG